MNGLAPGAERTASAGDMLFENVAEVPDQALDGLRRARGQRAKRVRPDEGVELVEQVDVGSGPATLLDALEDLDAHRQAVTARRAKSARLACEEALQVQRALDGAIVLAEHDERARAEPASELLDGRE